MPARFLRRPDGQTGSIPHDVVVNIPYIATAVDTWVFFADSAYEVVAIYAMPRVAGSDGSAVTADILKASGTTDAASGATVCASANAINLKGTADTLQTISLSATMSARKLAAGDRLSVNFGGTLTAAVGLIQVHLKPLQTAGASK